MRSPGWREVEYRTWRVKFNYMSVADVKELRIIAASLEDAMESVRKIYTGYTPTFLEVVFDGEIKDIRKVEHE